MIKLVFFFAALAWASAGVVQQENKVIKGVDANEGEFPFMVSLRKQGHPPARSHHCGGSILTSRWALTAAHCCTLIIDVKDYKLYTGSIYLSRGGTMHAIDKVIRHEYYQPSFYFRNDVCLLRVSQPFNISNQVTLPPQDWPVGPDDRVTLAGWGLTQPNNQNSVPDRLQKGVDFVPLTLEKCGNITKIPMISGYLCLYGAVPGQTAWHGDSGGPVLKQNAQVGLTSFGFAYNSGMPGIYCRVAHYVDWIKKTLGPDASELKLMQI